MCHCASMAPSSLIRRLYLFTGSVVHFVLCVCDPPTIICVHDCLLGWYAPWQTPTAPECPAVLGTSSSIRTEVPTTFYLHCLQTGAKVTTTLSRKPQGTRNMHSVSTTQAPSVERRSETDWLTATVEMAEAWNETW